MQDDPKQWAYQWFEEVWNKGRREAIAELMAPGALIHDSGITVIGPAGFYEFFDRLQATGSGIKVNIHEALAEGDKICVRWTSTFKHTGDGMGPAPTGNQIETTGITIVRVQNGKLVEGWQNWDMLGLISQLNGQDHTTPLHIGHSAG